MPQPTLNPKSKSKKTKYIVIGVALALAAAGYFGYRSLLVKPEINEIRRRRRGESDNSQGAGLQWGGEQQEIKTERVTQPRDPSNSDGRPARVNKRRKGDD